MQRSILAVSPNLQFLEQIRSHLEEGGRYRVQGVTSGADALALVSSTYFDLAILDANLAGPSVSPVATALERRSIPFIVVSGYSQWELLLPLRKAPFVPKPVRRETLLAAVAGFDRKLSQQIA